jgi:hypothetical protein
MKTYNQLMTEVFGLKKKEKVDAPERYPSKNKETEWMDKKVSYFASVYPNDLYRLFDPSSGDYLPASVHAGSAWNSKIQDYYRKIKRQYPIEVQKAKKEYHKAKHLSSSMVGDPEDFE